MKSHKCFFCGELEGIHPHMFYYKLKNKPFFLCSKCELNYLDIEKELIEKLKRIIEVNK